MCKKNILIILFLISSCLLSSPLHAEMRPVLKNRAGIPPFDILKEILSANSMGESLKNRPGRPVNSPYVTWLADSDARVQPDFILAAPSHKIFTVRNLANQVTTSLAALDYGIRYLHCPVLLISGNTDNQAIRLFTEGYDGMAPAIQHELDHLHLPLVQSKKTDKQKDDTARQLELIERNVDYQVEQALIRYEERIRKNRLVVVGSVLDIANHYGKGKYKLIITNINGETDGKKLKTIPLFRTFPPELLIHIGRPTVQEKKASMTGP